MKRTLTPPTDADLTWRVPADHKLAGATQAHVWAQQGNVDGLKRWQTAGGSLDVIWEPAAGGDGSTPLLFAVMHTQSEAMAWLLGAGVDVQATNARGRNALHLVAHRFSSGTRAEADLIQLIQAGVSLEAKEQEPLYSGTGMTPFEAELNRYYRDDQGKDYRLEHLCRLIDAGFDARKGTPAHEGMENILRSADFVALADRAARVPLIRERQAALQNHSPAPRPSRARPRS